MSEPARDLKIVWEDICMSGPYRGSWVALRDVTFAEGRPVEGVLVDYDLELGALISRVQLSGESGCTLAFCDDHNSGIRRSRSTGRFSTERAN